MVMDFLDEMGCREKSEEFIVLINSFLLPAEKQRTFSHFFTTGINCNLPLIFKRENLLLLYVQMCFNSLGMFSERNQQS